MIKLTHKEISSVGGPSSVLLSLSFSYDHSFDSIYNCRLIYDRTFVDTQITEKFCHDYQIFTSYVDHRIGVTFVLITKYDLFGIYSCIEIPNNLNKSQR